MRPVDPALLREIPEARMPVAALGLIGAASGALTIGSVFALASLVVAVADSASITAPALILTALLAARALLAAGAELVAAWSGQRVTHALRSRLLRGWLTMPAEHRPDPAHAVTLATQGADSVEPHVARYLPALVHAAVVPALALGALVLVDWPSAVLVGLTVPLLPTFAALIGRTTERSTRRRWTALADLSGHFLDVVRGLPTLVSYGRAERQVTTIEDVSERHRTATMRTLRLAFLSSTALELLATISVALVAVACGLRLAAGAMPLETALIAILLAPEAYWPIRRVGAEFHSAADGAEALTSLLAPSASASQPGSAAERVSVRDLSYTYAGGVTPTLSHLHLGAGVGLTVVTGPSGAGKTTLLEILAGLRTPTAGTVVAPRAHLVTQRPFLPAGTVGDALRLGNDAPDHEVWEALRNVELDGVVAALPDGLGTRLGDDGFGLSAGQRARIALARALLAPEPLVLLDEPTAHLDPASVDAAHRAIRGLARERVVVCVTHRPELVALTDERLSLGAEAVAA